MYVGYRPVWIKVKENQLDSDLNGAQIILLRLVLLTVLALGVNSLIQLGISSSKSAFACECIEPKPPNEALIESGAVFSGKVTGIRSDNFSKVVTFDVDRLWKGISNETVTAVTGLGDADCGFPFQQGVEYLVYAYSNEEPFDASGCGRTKPLSNAQEDLKVLGVGYLPVQNAGSSDNSQVLNNSIPFVAGIGAVIAGTIAFLILRKRKK